MSKQDILDGAVEYATFITSHIPQKDNANNITYYFSGSLAMLLMASAKNIAFIGADNDGDIKFISPQQKISAETQHALKKGTRPLSTDIDIVAIRDDIFAHKGIYYNLANIRKNCHLATELCPAWSKLCGTMYFDILSDERIIDNHNMSIIELANDRKVLIVNPIDLMLHKLSETIYLKTKSKQTDKYEKDIKDLACLLSGIISMDIIPENFEEYIAEVMKNNSTSSISKNLIHNHETEIEAITADLKHHIDKHTYEKVKKVMATITSFNKSISQNQPQ